MSSDDPAVIREMLLNSPHDLAILKERNPPLAEALLSGDLGTASQLGVTFKCVEGREDKSLVLKAGRKSYLCHP